MNYTSLKTSVADFLNRQDLVAAIPTFIELAEAACNRAIRHRKMLQRSTATLDAQFTELPEDYLEAKNVQLNADPVCSLTYVTMEHADLLRAGAYRTPQKPRHYTLVGDTIEVVPAPNGDYTIELVYYARIPPLSDAAPSNWLILDHPDVYLYGALMQSAPYLKDDARLSTWGLLYEGGITQANAESYRAEVSGSALTARTFKW
jgi:hypothetical protein